MTDFTIRRDPTVTTADDSFVAPETWTSFHNASERDGSGLTVAVMDSGIGEHPLFPHNGISVHHPDIDGLPTDGVDQVGHGTAAAGALAYMAPNVDKLVDVPIFGDSGRTGLNRIRVAYQWLIDHADAIDMVNMSWGASKSTAPIDALHDQLERAGVEAVVAAGNTDGQTGSPATASRAFAVAACTTDETMTRWSSPTDNVAALGKNIAMPSPSSASMGTPIPESEYSGAMQAIGGDWIKASGTSFACPMTLGMAATYRSLHADDASATGNPDVRSPAERAFHASATDIPGTDEDGVGYVNYDGAVGADPPDPTASATVWSLPWSKRDFIHVDGDALDDGEYTANLETLREAFEPR